MADKKNKSLWNNIKNAFVRSSKKVDHVEDPKDPNEGKWNSEENTRLREKHDVIRENEYREHREKQQLMGAIAKKDWEGLNDLIAGGYSLNDNKGEVLTWALICFHDDDEVMDELHILGASFNSIKKYINRKIREIEGDEIADKVLKAIESRDELSIKEAIQLAKDLVARKKEEREKEIRVRREKLKERKSELLKRQLLVIENNIAFKKRKAIEKARELEIRKQRKERERQRDRKKDRDRGFDR